MNIEIITLIATSTVFATILSSILNYWISRILKKNDFKNEYFKIVITKRLEVYENIEKQVFLLKTSVMDTDDNKAYHRIFSLGEDFFLKNTEPIWFANSGSIWINSDTREKVKEFIHLINDVSFKNNKDSNYLIEFGKKNYLKIAYLRDDIEELIQQDILTLYDFSKIKESTKNTTRLREINIINE